MVFIFYSFIITSYLKKLIGIKFFSIKQCQAELSSRFILLVFPTIPKMSPPPPFLLLVAPTINGLLYPFTQTYCLGETFYMGGENPAQQQKSTHFSNQKNPPHQTAIFNTSFIYNCSHCCCIIFFTSGFIYRYIMQILISPWLMNLRCSMIKALNGPNSFKQNPQSHSAPIAIWNNLFQ